MTSYPDLSGNGLGITNVEAPDSITGSLAATGSSSAFTPYYDKPLWIKLSGTWAGTVVVERSTDGGTTWQGLTAGGTAFASYTANVQEQITSEAQSNAQYRVTFTRVSGTVNYRLGYN